MPTTLLPGDPAPAFQCHSSVNPRFNFDTAAGRYVIISFFGSSQIPSSEEFLHEIVNRGDRFDVTNTIFFGVSVDPEDVERIRHRHPGRIYFHDLDLAVSRKFGVVDDSRDPERPTLVRQTFVLDQGLRVLGVIPMTDDDVPRQIDAIFSLLDSLPNLRTLNTAAPVIIVPHVFEPAMCRRLIDYYHAKGGEDSGFMRDLDGKTVGILDYAHKRRMDCELLDENLIAAAQQRIKRRIVPAIKHAYQFDVTRIERHTVACYDAAQGAHFRAHRDNTTLGTAHRRFAVTINLNSPEYEGGEIWFPEFSRKRFKAPSGSAIVFSCSLLHEVPPVTRGVRYAFLPFLYDDAAAALRERNSKHLGDLSGATGARSPGGGKVTHVCDSPPPNGNGGASKSDLSKVILDGSAGCGNPEGCESCLTAPTYPLNKPAAAAKEPKRD